MVDRSKAAKRSSLLRGVREEKGLFWDAVAAVDAGVKGDESFDDDGDSGNDGEGYGQGEDDEEEKVGEEEEEEDEEEQEECNCKAASSFDAERTRVLLDEYCGEEVKRCVKRGDIAGEVDTMEEDKGGTAAEVFEERLEVRRERRPSSFSLLESLL